MLGALHAFLVTLRSSACHAFNHEANGTGEAAALAALTWC
jgi:hypothetical protein